MKVNELRENVDYVGAFRQLWKCAAPPEKKLIRDIVLSEDDPVSRVPQKRIVDLYHEILPMLRKVKAITPGRQSHLRARWRDMPSLEEWESYFRLVSRCHHLVGKGPEWNGRIWRADFDWLINASNWIKVIEGKYGE